MVMKHPTVANPLTHKRMAPEGVIHRLASKNITMCKTKNKYKYGSTLWVSWKTLCLNFLIHAIRTNAAER
ncbi:hypothetical protein VCHENC02_1191B, partial [Vibrio harveyi]